MNSKKCFLFIDGSNLYHGLKQNKIFDYFKYDWFYSELTKKFEIQKTFFYDAIKSFSLEPEQYAAQQRFHEKLKKQIPNIVIRHRKLKYIKVDSRVEKAKNNIDFCKSCKPKLEEFLKESGLHKLSKEKGIDIMLVADMIKASFQKKFDTALLVTGDADFVPAVELTQLLGKEVINIHCYAGSSSELRNMCDSHIKIELDGKSNCILKYY
ncbi:NYN domain-containing protein [Candidatus Micrarchaeota archaeon]|nr:NYN domain-containing protein [Candidatus Micrarchaeota archaeon]MBU2476396.1 NYN domain-containing protein [Candidatus Micrarchaeota archaeon]